MPFTSTFEADISKKVYENTLAHRLRNKAIDVKQQMPIDIYDEDGTLVGHYTADLLIESQLIVELKACHTLTTEHLAQVFGYLRGSRLPWDAYQLWLSETSDQKTNPLTSRGRAVLRGIS